MHIIIEGIDGSGKTTIAEKLSQLVKIPVHRPLRDCGVKLKTFSHLLPGWNDTTEDFIVAELLKKLDGSIISDRGIISGVVYRAHKDNSGSYNLKQMLKAYSEMCPDHTIIFWIKRPVDKCYSARQRYAMRDLRHLNGLFLEYLQCMSNYGIRVVEIDNSSEDPNFAVEAIKRYCP